MNIETILESIVNEMNSNVIADCHSNAVKYNKPVEMYLKISQKYTFEKARKYYKVWKENGASRSIVMFVDFEGNIFKPASCKAPAKRARGVITNWKNSVEFHFNNSLIFVK